MIDHLDPEVYEAAHKITRFVQQHLDGLGKLLTMAQVYRDEERLKHGGQEHKPAVTCPACTAEARALIEAKLGEERLKQACCSLCIERLWAEALEA